MVTKCTIFSDQTLNESVELLKAEDRASYTKGIIHEFMLAMCLLKASAVDPPGAIE